MIPPNVQITNLKWRFVIIGMMSIIIVVNKDIPHLDLFLLIIIWLLVLASLGSLTTLKNFLYGKFNYRDQRDLR